jgi:hypothetical protein
VGGGSLGPRPGGLSQQVVPGRLLAAKITLWQFDQQRRGRLAYRGEVADGHQAIRAARRAPGQAVQALVCLALVPVQVTHGVEDDRLPRRLSACTRRTDCWAIVPLGNNTAAGLPSSSAISASSSATTPPSP